MRSLTLSAAFLMLLPVLRSADDDLPAEVKVLLAKFREDLKSKTPMTRASAYKTIAELGPKAKSERRAMCAGLLDVAPIVRTSAADCLKQVDESMYKTALAIAIEQDMEVVAKARQHKGANAALVPLVLKIANDNSATASQADNVNDAIMAKIRKARANLTISVHTLAAIDPEDTAVNQAVITMLANPIPSLRATALEHVDELKNKKLALKNVLAIGCGKRDSTAIRAQAIRLERFP